MIIGIAGPIASGKSTLSRALVEKFSLKLISFGDYVRHEAHARGLDISNRAALQDFGQSLVDGDLKSFVRGVFDWVDFQSIDRVVLDGVRHDAVWDEVVGFALSHGSQAKLIFMDMPDVERRRRLVARGLSYEQALAQDRHASEADVPTRLAEKADVRVDALQDKGPMLAFIGRQLELS